MMKKRVLVATVWLVLFLFLTIFWWAVVQSIINWGTALQNWLAPLGVIGMLVGFFLVNSGLHYPASRSNRAVWSGYLLGLVSFCAFLYSWGEQGYDLTNMFHASVSVMLVLGTLAMVVDFIRALSQRGSSQRATQSEWLRAKELQN